MVRVDGRLMTFSAKDDFTCCRLPMDNRASESHSTLMILLNGVINHDIIAHCVLQNDKNRDRA